MPFALFTIMKTFLFIFGLMVLLPQVVWGEDSVFVPFREGQSNYVSEKMAQKSLKRLQSVKDDLTHSVQEILEGFEEDSSSADYEILFRSMIESLSPIAGKKLKYPEIRRKYLVDALNVLRSSSVIDDTVYRLFLDLVMQKYPEPEEDNLLGPAISLKDYIAKKSALKLYYDKLATTKDEVSETSANPFPRDDYKMQALKRRGLSVRERIVYLYTPKQIKEMAQIMSLSLRVADASKMYTTVEFRDQSESMVFKHSPTDQYRFSIRLLRMKKLEAESNPLSIGTRVEDLDIIASAYELGIISYEEISLVAHNKDFYKPKISFGKKIVKYLGDLGLLALRVSPVTAGYAIIPMLMYNSYVQAKQAGEQIDEDSFFFTLPEKNS